MVNLPSTHPYQIYLFPVLSALQKRGNVVNVGLGSQQTVTFLRDGHADVKYDSGNNNTK